MANLLRNIAKASTQLGQKRETEPTLEEIAAELDVLPGVVLETMLCARGSLGQYL